jgi:hypothetical protein
MGWTVQVRLERNPTMLVTYRVGLHGRDPETLSVDVKNPRDCLHEVLDAIRQAGLPTSPNELKFCYRVNA